MALNEWKGVLVLTQLSPPNKSLPLAADLPNSYTRD